MEKKAEHMLSRNPHKVFVVHGRNKQVYDAMFGFIPTEIRRLS
jgi:hypothetical protein